MREEPVKCSGCTKGAIKLGCPVHDQQRRYVCVVDESAGTWLQLGAFSSREGAESFRDRVSRELSWNYEPVQMSARDGVHRVRLGPYRNRDEALAIADKVRKTLGFAPTLTNAR